MPTTENHNLARRWLRGLAWASVISAFALIILGGVVRVTGSGLGCGGDWPLCDGRLFPAMTAADIIEYSHRLVASALVGPLIIATAAVAWLKFRREKWLSLSAAAAVIMLLMQGGLGGVTVLTELPGHIVAAHLALAQALLGCLLLILVAAYRHPATAAPTLPSADANSPLILNSLQDDNRPAAQAIPPATDNRPAAANRPAASRFPRRAIPFPLILNLLKDDQHTPTARFPRWAMWSAVATYLLLLSGAFVTATPGALAACPDWPLCQGWTLPFDHLPAVNMFHRIVAALLGLLILYTLHLGLRQKDPENSAGNSSAAAVLRRLSLAGLILFTAQLLVGGLAVWTAFPVELRALHIALATAVWATMAALALLTARPMAAPSA